MVKLFTKSLKELPLFKLLLLSVFTLVHGCESIHEYTPKQRETYYRYYKDKRPVAPPISTQQAQPPPQPPTLQQQQQQPLQQLQTKTTVQGIHCPNEMTPWGVVSRRTKYLDHLERAIKNAVTRATELGFLANTLNNATVQVEKNGCFIVSGEPAYISAPIVSQ